MTAELDTVLAAIDNELEARLQRQLAGTTDEDFTKALAQRVAAAAVGNRSAMEDLKAMVRTNPAVAEPARALLAQWSERDRIRVPPSSPTPPPEHTAAPVPRPHYPTPPQENASPATAESMRGTPAAPGCALHLNAAPPVMPPNVNDRWFEEEERRVRKLGRPGITPRRYGLTPTKRKHTAQFW
jgi:hypothetical protein